MSAESKKSTGWMVALMLLGVAAIFLGPKWLPLLIPAALIVWYGADWLALRRNSATDTARAGRN